MTSEGQLLGEGSRRSSGDQARRYNLLAARLMAELVKSSLGPRGLEKMFIDVMGEVTVTKDGATLLRKIDVEHPAAKMMIEASNAVDNEVGDGTTSVVVLAGALVQKAEELLDWGIAPSTISDGYVEGLEIALAALNDVSRECDNSDPNVMESLVRSCLRSKSLSLGGDHISRIIVDAICAVTDFDRNIVDIDDVKIEEKEGNISETELVMGVVVDKTFDSTSMPQVVENARIALIDDELEGKRTKTDAEILVTSPSQMKEYSDEQASMIRAKVEHIVESGANAVFSRKGINTMAQHLLTEAGIASIRRVKENDLLWLAKATGASVSEKLDHGHDHHAHHHHEYHKEHHNSNHYHHADIDIKLGFAQRVYEKRVGDDRMVFVQGCNDPKTVTLLLRANSKRTLDECHRSVLDAMAVLRDFIARPAIVAGGGATEAAAAKVLRERAMSFQGRVQLVVLKFAEALEEIPLTIARNAGMDVVDTLTQLRAAHSKVDQISFGVDAMDRKVKRMSDVAIEPVAIKEQILKTAVEVTNMLIRVDDVMMAKPKMSTHTHSDGTKHSHAGGDKEHQHDYFDRLGRQQRPSHHYY